MSNYKKQLNKTIARKGFAMILQCTTNGYNMWVNPAVIGLRSVYAGRHIMPVVVHWLLCFYELQRSNKNIQRQEGVGGQITPCQWTRQRYPELCYLHEGLSNRGCYR